MARASSTHRLGALGVALVLCAGPVRAQPPSDAEPQLDESYKATAQKLFEEGRRLMEEGRFEEACHDFAESQRLDPALGTRFNLADCYERLGKLASAWVNYVGVADEAERLGQMDRAAFAREKADALEPQLATIRIDITERHRELRISRGGTTIGYAQWSKPFPVDRGTHRFEARAAGFEPWSEDIDVPEDGTEVVVVIPALVAIEPDPQPVPAPVPTVTAPLPPQQDAAPQGLNRQQVAGIVLSSLGVVGLGVGTGFGIAALQKNGDADERCPQPNACFQDGADLRDEARRFGTVSTAMFITGGVLLAAGIVTLSTARMGKRRGRKRARVEFEGAGARIRW